MSEADSTRAVARSSSAFLSGTLLSRISGLGRDLSMAFVFGSHPAIAAFMVAFRFANLMRRLFGEGPVAASFIPHFEQLRSVSPEKGAHFFRDLFFSLAVVLIGAICLGEVGLFSLYKWGGLKPENAQILQLTQLMLPGVFFICLFGLSAGLLQCERRYFMTGLAPVGFNAIWIATVFFLQGKDPLDSVFFLSVAMILAFLMQWLLVAPRTLALLKFSGLRPRLFSSEVRSVIRPFFLATVGIAATQVNSALDAVFARCASLEGPAYLWYAIRIHQLPLALFGVALSAALLPPLARALKGNEMARYLELLRFAFRRSFNLIFPCTLVLFALGVSGVSLLYGRGSFSNEAIYHTVLCLWGYSLGLLPAVFVLLLAPAFYADREYRLPMRGSIYSMLFNLLLTTLFVFYFRWGAVSTAIATSLAAWLNYFYLSYHLRRKLGEPLLNREAFSSFLKIGGAALCAALATLLLGYFLQDPTLQMVAGERQPLFQREIGAQAAHFSLLGCCFAGVFFLIFRKINAKAVSVLSDGEEEKV